MSLSDDERKELELLRRYKSEHEGKAITRAFTRLEQLMESHHDAVMSIRAFRIIGDCLLTLKDPLQRKGCCFACATRSERWYRVVVP